MNEENAESSDSTPSSSDVEKQPTEETDKPESSISEEPTSSQASSEESENKHEIIRPDAPKISFVLQKNVRPKKPIVISHHTKTTLEKLKEEQKTEELKKATKEKETSEEKNKKETQTVEDKTKKGTETADDIEEDDEESEYEEDSPKKKKQSKPEDTEYDPKNVHYKDDVAIYTDPKTGYQYKWCKDTNQWLPNSDITYGFEDDVHTYTDADGVKYFWDVDKNAWFPKIDDDFMARYQMNYGFIDNTTKDDEKKDEEKKDEDKKDEEEKDDEQSDAEEEENDEKEKGVKRKAAEPAALPSWFEMSDQQNTKVYVSNLPTDISEQEFVDLMQKCGLVMRDMQSGKMKVKLYTVPETDILKGDGLCTYIKIESVELALNLLDDYVYRGKKLKVERAKFEMKGDYNPNLKPKKRKRKDKDKLKKMQEKLFDWRPEKMRGERAKHERIVIIKNLFEPSLFDKDVSLILEYQQDLREECGKCGVVKRVLLYDRHPEGVAQITMKDPEEADEVVTLLNGRWFGQRKLTSEIWDGKTKYKIAETDSEISQRIDKWDKFLESDEALKKDTAEKGKTEQSVTETAIKNQE